MENVNMGYLFAEIKNMSQELDLYRQVIISILLCVTLIKYRIFYLFIDLTEMERYYYK